MFNGEELTGTTEYLTLYTRCRINRCRYNRVRLYKHFSEGSPHIEGKIHSPILKNDAIDSLHMSVYLYQTKWRHIQEGNGFHSHYVMKLNYFLLSVIMLLNNYTCVLSYKKNGWRTMNYLFHVGQRDIV